MFFKPQKGTRVTKCAVCAFLWLLLICGSVAAQEAFIDDLQERSFRYFWEQADPQTGLVPDRARMDASPLPPSHQNVASIAATGFGLTGICIAAERKWIDEAQAFERTRNTLRFFDARAFHQRGWFYHWMDSKTGERRWNSEVSSIDTALLLAGVLTVRQCFRDDQEIVRLADRIYRRVDFRWMLNGDPRLYHTVGNLNPVFYARAGTHTAKIPFFTCSQSDLQRIRSHQLPGMHCGAIVIVTKATATSLPSAYPCSCTSTLMRGSTIETGAKQRATVSTTFATQSRPRSLIALSA